MTGRIVDRLVMRYGAECVFIDVDSIPLGVDFRTHIQQVLAASDVFLAVIGPRWFGELEGGDTRLAQPTDPVRVEVETALRNALPIIPVLVDGAGMPRKDSLPETLAPFHFLNAATVATGLDFHVHMDRLIAAIDSLLTQKYGAAPPRRDAPAPRTRAQTLQHLAIALAPAIGILALPFAAAFGTMAPPWPYAAAPITAIVEALTVLFVHQMTIKAAPRLFRWLVIGAGVLAVLTAGGYSAGVALYTYQAPNVSGLLAKGFECTKDAALVYKDKCPGLGPDQLSEAAYDAGALWTPGSIGLVDAALASLWFGGFVAVSVLAAGFLSARLRAPAPTASPR